jgi:hypothetical protein
MKQIDEIEIRLWPFRLSARGDQAIAAVKWPLAIVLIAVAVAILGAVALRGSVLIQKSGSSTVR